MGGGRGRDRTRRRPAARRHPPTAPCGSQTWRTVAQLRDLVRPLLFAMQRGILLSDECVNIAVVRASEPVLYDGSMHQGRVQLWRHLAASDVTLRDQLGLAVLRQLEAAPGAVARMMQAALSPAPTPGTAVAHHTGHVGPRTLRNGDCRLEAPGSPSTTSGSDRPPATAPAPTTSLPTRSAATAAAAAAAAARSTAGSNQAPF